MNNQEDLIAAIIDGDEARLNELLLAGVDDGLLEATISGNQPTNHSIGAGMTLLQLASIRKRKQGDPAKVLIEHGAVIDLHSACGLGLKDRMERLVSDRPEAFDEAIDTYVPLQFAITSGRFEVVRLLAEWGDNVNKDLFKVAYFGWEDDAVGQEYQPWKPIHMASLWCFDAERLLVVEAIANAGADLDALSPLDGFRPLHLLAMANRVEAIEVLIGRGVDVDSRTEKCRVIDLPDEPGPIQGLGCTALMVAAAEGFVEATERLLKLHADRNAVNDQGQTALDLARKRFWKGQPYDTVVQMLREEA